MADTTATHEPVGPPSEHGHFATLAQQHEANVVGMWVFLVTELMLFGGLLTAYAFYRFAYPDAFAEGSRHLAVPIGTINTVILIASSVMVALALYSVQTGRRREQLLFLALTLALGLAFLGLKGYEWYEHYVHELVPGVRFAGSGPNEMTVQIFLVLYFALTGLHAIHMIIGLGLVAAILFFSWRGRFSPSYYTPFELVTLYWHFVDIVWIFLFPLLYLLALHGD